MSHLCGTGGLISSITKSLQHRYHQGGVCRSQPGRPKCCVSSPGSCSLAQAGYEAVALLGQEESLHFSEPASPALALHVQEQSSTPLDVDVGNHKLSLLSHLS